MKKLLTIVAVALIATACEGPVGPMGPQGPEGVVHKVYNYDLRITRNQWQKGEDLIGPHYFADLLIPQLDEEMIWGDGLYQLAWRYIEDGFEVRQTLETTIYHDDDGYLWSENISVQFSVGEARVIIRYSDFDMNRTPPVLMEFIFAGMY